jgi:putative membrane protein
MIARALRTLLGGVFMGTADLVPGVSGGTIALVLGIYERLVASIREGSSALGAVLRRNPGDFKRHFHAVEWGVLLPLLGGILLAIALLASLLERQLERNPTVIAGGFFGLVVVSVVVAWSQLRHPKGTHIVTALLVGLGMFLILGLGDGSPDPQPGLALACAAGALAICAMILPGISGSLILVLVGMYAPVLGVVTARQWGVIAVFALGAVVGLALFSQVLHWALTHHHDIVLAALVGLMGGSLRILWPWPDGINGAGLGVPTADWPMVGLAAVVGAVAVYLLTRLAASRETEFTR